MIGKWILIFGVLLVAVGAVVWLVESLGLPLAGARRHSAARRGLVLFVPHCDVHRCQRRADAAVERRPLVLAAIVEENDRDIRR